MSSYIIFIAIYFTVILFLNLIRNKIRNFKYASIIRHSIFFTPFLIPIFYYGMPNFIFNQYIFLSVFLSVTASLIALAIQIKDYKPFFNDDFLFLLPPVDKKIVATNVYSLMGSAFLEEIFYRGMFPKSNLFLDIVIVGFLFCFAHYINTKTRANFKWQSYIILFALSTVWIISFYISGSIIPAIIGHVVYNSMRLSVVINHYFYSKKNEKENLWREDISG